MYVVLVLRWSMTMRRSREISIPKIIAFRNAMVERVDVELGGYAFRIVTALLVETKRIVPSVFTRSGSSTPWTCTFVPVKVGVDWAAADVAARAVRVLTSPPIAIGALPNQVPRLFYCLTRLLFAAL